MYFATTDGFIIVILIFKFLLCLNFIVVILQGKKNSLYIFFLLKVSADFHHEILYYCTKQVEFVGIFFFVESV